MGEENKHIRFWTAVHDELHRALNTLPYGPEPERVSWDHPDEDWKNAPELGAKEDDVWCETDELIRTFCAKHAWPKRSKSDARYFVGRRITWALTFTRLLTIPDAKTGGAAIPKPPQSGYEFIEWLLVDAYCHRNPPSPNPGFRVATFGPDGSLVTRGTDEYLSSEPEAE